MPTRRQSNASGGRSASGPAPTAAHLGTAVLLTSALAYGLWLLVRRGWVSWPPGELLAGAFTIAGCLAVVGPAVLLRRGVTTTAEGGLGELLWMTGGLLIWVFNLAALARGNLVEPSMVTPLDASTMGLIILAVLLAGWRSHVGPWNWSWTNVIGWILATLWVGLAVADLLPDRLPTVASR